MYMYVDRIAWSHFLALPFRFGPEAVPLFLQSKTEHDRLLDKLTDLPGARALEVPRSREVHLN